MICKNYDRIKNEINSSQLLVVSKTQSIEDIRKLYNHGVYAFAENRINELKNKVLVLPSDIEWHFVGRLQTKKIRDIVKNCVLIHSVDSVKGIEVINKEACKIDKVQDVLIQLNISGEESKTGFLEENLTSVLDFSKGLKHVRILGIMTMAPYTDDEAELRRIFSKMQELFLNNDFSILSMGMSNDYKIAVEYGSTIVRIGSSIFNKEEE